MKKILLLGIFSMIQSADGNTFKIYSKDFSHNKNIPTKFSVKGGNAIPHIAWEHVPKNTKSLVLIVDDPDAPKPNTPWVHWLVYNIPATRNNLEYISGNQSRMEDGTTQGINSDDNTGYDGPNPPSGKVHHYHFKLYALDMIRSLKLGLTKQELMNAMKGHILGQATLTGLYKQ